MLGERFDMLPTQSRGQHNCPSHHDCSQGEAYTKRKNWNHRVYYGESRCMTHTSSPWICPSCMWYKYPKEDGVMRMLLSYCLITVVLVLYAVVALGDEQSHRKAAENLLLVMEVDKSLPKIVAQVVDTQVQQNPQLAPQREVLQRFLTKYLNWESVKED